MYWTIGCLLFNLNAGVGQFGDTGQDKGSSGHGRQRHLTFLVNLNVMLDKLNVEIIKAFLPVTTCQYNFNFSISNGVVSRLFECGQFSKYHHKIQALFSFISFFLWGGA